MIPIGKGQTSGRLHGDERQGELIKKKKRMQIALIGYLQQREGDCVLVERKGSVQSTLTLEGFDICKCPSSQ